MFIKTSDMQKNTSVTLGEHFETFIASQVDNESNYFWGS
jgi:Arc/MetJ-type ribon-helix-helix transcriptional regulator